MSIRVSAIMAWPKTSFTFLLERSREICTNDPSTTKKMEGYFSVCVRAYPSGFENRFEKS